VPGVMIGIDPHKGSHTATAIDDQERVLGQTRVRASQAQTDELVRWSSRWPVRTWAIENAMGLGYLLAQRLVGVGERVVDIQPKMAARVRLLGTRSGQQERCQRCPLGCRRSVASRTAR
jgi:hypothetical protein